jgi:tRNA threonylcarbamoyladenosine biosynthesis protein TsaE
VPKYLTKNSKETHKLGKKMAAQLANGGLICLEGNLGSGKTTFAQGLLKELKVRGPYTSPTFLIMKKYGTRVFHIDAYRIKEKDILNLGWEELIKQKGSIIIIEWADRIRKIIPKNAIWIKFKWLDENKRELNY